MGGSPLLGWHPYLPIPPHGQAGCITPWASVMTLLPSLWPLGSCHVLRAEHALSWLGGDASPSCLVHPGLRSQTGHLQVGNRGLTTGANCPHYSVGTWQGLAAELARESLGGCSPSSEPWRVAGERVCTLWEGRHSPGCGPPTVFPSSKAAFTSFVGRLKCWLARSVQPPARG